MKGIIVFLTFNVSFNFKPKIDKDITLNIIKELDLEKYINKKVSLLSGGEKQKVAIAMSLSLEPKYLVFDEPTANLDLKNEKMILDLVLSILTKKDIGIIMSLHNLNLALTYGDYFFLLKEKKIKYQGDKTILNNDILSDIYDIKINILDNENKKFIYIGE